MECQWSGTQEVVNQTIQQPYGYNKDVRIYHMYSMIDGSIALGVADLPWNIPYWHLLTRPEEPMLRERGYLFAYQGKDYLVPESDYFSIMSTFKPNGILVTPKSTWQSSTDLMKVSPSGEMWIHGTSSFDAIFARMVPEGLEHYNPFPAYYSGSHILTWAPAIKEGLWFTIDDSLFQLNSQGYHNVGRLPITTSFYDPTPTLLLTKTGALWMGTNKGITRIDTTDATWEDDEIFNANPILTPAVWMAELSDGTIAWYGEAGSVSFRKSNGSTSSQMIPTSTWGTLTAMRAGKNKDLWYTYDSLLCHVIVGSNTVCDSMPNQSFHDLAIDTAGMVYLTGSEDSVLWSYANGSFTAIPTPIKSYWGGLASDSKGNVFVAGQKQLYVYNTKSATLSNITFGSGNLTPTWPSFVRKHLLQNSSTWSLTGRTLHMESKTYGVASLHDLQGRTLRRMEHPANSHQQIGLQDLPAGKYVLRLHGKSHLIVLH